MGGFVCIYYGNTGSSWLLNTLGTSPQVIVPGFEPVEGWAWKAPREERVEWVRTALNPPVERSGPTYDAWVEELRASPQVRKLGNKPTFEQVGFKMNDLAVFALEPLADVLKEAKAKVIVLARDNRIKHALSLYRYHEEDKSQFGGKGVRPPSKVDLKTFDKWVEESFRLHTRLMEAREALIDLLGPQHVADLSYEEFASEEGKRQVIDRLTDFLGIEPLELAEGPFTKATPDDLRSAVVNYRTLRLRYLFTPMRRYFRE
jgi:hypothetical protein